MGHGRGWVGWFAAVLVLVCVPVLVPGIRAQSGTDGAIGGRVLSATGVPVSGAVVMVRGVDTGLSMRAVSGAHGEFLVVRLPVGEYSIAVESAGAEAAVPGPIAVELGEVAEIEVRLQAGGPENSANGSGRVLSEGEIAALPVNGGDLRALELTVAGANDAAGADSDAGDVSFRGVGVAQNSVRLDGTSSDESFSGGRVGAGCCTSSWR